MFSIGNDVAVAGVAGCEDVAVVVVSGELDYGATPRLRACILGHVGAGRQYLLVDLSEVTFIDSTAIGVLVSAGANLSQADRGSLAVVCAGENTRVLRIFEIAGLASVICLYHSRQQAQVALATMARSRDARVALAARFDAGRDGGCVDELA
jgi:anti-sigma B factor antagonist